MGTPGRSKAFHEAYYGDMGDNGLPDQIAAMRQLAERHPWIDLERAGIYGHSGGGFAAAGAILRYPDFFKVAVSGAGNHDNRSYNIYWAEKYQGLLTRDSLTKKDNFEASANQTMAANLRGSDQIFGLQDIKMVPDRHRRELETQIRKLEGEVVVPQSMALEEACHGSTPRCGSQVIRSGAGIAYILAKLARIRSPYSWLFSGWNCTPHTPDPPTMLPKGASYSHSPRSSACVGWRRA